MSDGTNYTVNHLGRQDLDTGKQYDGLGNEVEPGLDPVAKQELAKLLGPRTATLVGNVADLQVSGAKGADGGEEGTELPSSRQPLVHTDPQAKPVVESPDVVAADEQLVAKVDYVPQSELAKEEVPEQKSEPIPSQAEVDAQGSEKK